MPLSVVPPKTVSVVTFECDRCHKTVVREQDVTLLPSGAPSTLDPEPELPDGWKEVSNPVLSGPRLLFDRRDCMGVWFATFVRVAYGGPEELPPRRRRSADGELVQPDPSLGLSEDEPEPLAKRRRDQVEPEAALS
jgi:hypothetical protein